MTLAVASHVSWLGVAPPGTSGQGQPISLAYLAVNSTRETTFTHAGRRRHGSARIVPRRRRSVSWPLSHATSGGRGRPLYVLNIDEPYAPTIPIATKSPRSNSGMAAEPNVSVDSHTGPSIRTLKAGFT